MSLWNDFWDFVEDTVDDVGDTIQGAWDAVKSNPIGAITSAVAMAYGIPPTWAGALGGAAGAAATGGNVVKAAITGGAMGYMGQAAGAATGSAGVIAQTAASGAAAGVTGAILTGQDVLTAAKQGLILGAVTGGVVKLMTPAEAIASVPKDVIANAATSADPMGDLINKMGWTSSDSSIAAASKAFSQNAATTVNMLRDSVPDYVLEAAAKLPSNYDPGTYIANELGWNKTNITIGAANNAFNEYKAATIQAKQPAKTQPTQQPTGPSPEQVALEANNRISNSAGITSVDADVLMNNGYTPTQVDSLIKAGYTGADLVDLASTGVKANTLTTLANTPIPEATISNLLEKGISANDIAYVSPSIGKNLTVDGAVKLLDAGLTSVNNNYTMTAVTSGGLTADQAARLLQGGASQNDIYNIGNLAKSKLVNADTAIGLYENGVSINNIRAAGVNGTAEADLLKLTAKPVAPAPAQPPNTLALNDGTFMDQSGNILDGTGKIIKPAVVPSAPISQTATGYTPAQEAQYNELIRQGMSPADAVRQLETGSGASRIDVGGSAGFAGNPSGVVPEYRTPNTDLATQQQIDSGAANYNAGANAWEVPATPEIVVTAPRPEPQQPIVPIIPPVIVPPASGGVAGGGATGGTGAGTGTGNQDDTPEIVITAPREPTPPVVQPPLTPPTQVVIPEQPKIPEVVVDQPPVTEPPVTEPPPVVNPPIVPIVPPVDPNNPDGSYRYGSYTLGEGNKINIPTGLNPGWIAPTPKYQPANDSQSQYYWGTHPYQPGPMFDPVLYNNVPAAPAQPWGSTYRQTSATPQQILQAMGQYYPLQGSTNGPVRP